MDSIIKALSGCFTSPSSIFTQEKQPVEQTIEQPIEQPVTLRVFPSYEELTFQITNKYGMLVSSQFKHNEYNIAKRIYDSNYSVSVTTAELVDFYETWQPVQSIYYALCLVEKSKSEKDKFDLVAHKVFVNEMSKIMENNIKNTTGYSYLSNPIDKTEVKTQNNTYNSELDDSLYSDYYPTVQVFGHGWDPTVNDDELIYPGIAKVTSGELDVTEIYGLRDRVKYNPNLSNYDDVITFWEYDNVPNLLISTKNLLSNLSSTATMGFYVNGIDYTTKFQQQGISDVVTLKEIVRFLNRYFPEGYYLELHTDRTTIKDFSFDLLHYTTIVSPSADELVYEMKGQSSAGLFNLYPPVDSYQDLNIQPIDWSEYYKLNDVLLSPILTTPQWINPNKFKYEYELLEDDLIPPSYLGESEC